MFDIKSAKVTGALNLGRARVAWHDGRLFAFTKDNQVFQLISAQPKRRKGYIRAWDAPTEKGVVHIDETCWTCGGWLKMAMKSINELTGGSK